MCIERWCVKKLVYNAMHVSDKYVFMLQFIIIVNKSLLITLIPSEPSSLIDIGANQPSGAMNCEAVSCVTTSGPGCRGEDRQYPQGVAGTFLCGVHPHQGAPLATTDFFSHLTVLGQRLVERPRADVDRDEDENTRRRGWLPRRPQRRAPFAAQPPAAGTPGHPRGAVLPWERSGAPAEPSVYYLRMAARTPPLPRPGR